MRIPLIVLALVLTLGLLAFAGGAKETGTGAVALTMGSWRADDVEQLKALLAAYAQKNPGVQITFQPTNPPDYNATLRLQLESGTGPDLMYARSYATGQKLFADGFLADVSDLPGLKQNFDEGARAPWQSTGGRSFAVPFVAVSHGVYYNKDIFNKLGLSVPTSWEDFLAVSQKIKDSGTIPLANSLGDEWDIAEVVFMSLAPNYLGGREGRLALEAGKRPWNDAGVVAAFQAMKDLAPQLPKGFEALTYNDSNALFATGKAAMFFDGSWTIGTFKDVPFSWGVFAVPPPKGKPGFVTFHPDAGMAMNAATKNPQEARAFLAWLCSKEGAETSARYLPTGFFPMSSVPVTISDPHANEFLGLNKGRGTDVRLPWPRLMDGTPSGYNLIMQGSINVIKGDQTPKQAADALATGLASWYKP